MFAVRTLFDYISQAIYSLSGKNGYILYKFYTVLIANITVVVKKRMQKKYQMTLK